jgi:hypothetical protein
MHEKTEVISNILQSDNSLTIASIGLFSAHHFDWVPHDLITSLVGITLLILNGIKIYKVVDIKALTIRIKNFFSKKTKKG